MGHRSDGELRAAPLERAIVWHRWSPPAEPSRDAVALATLWRIDARERFVGAGAELLLEFGGTAVFALSTEQVVRAVELCLSSIQQVEREHTHGEARASAREQGPSELRESTQSEAHASAREQGQAGAGGISYGITVGAIERSEATGTYFGDALDRAQTLANAADPGELLLDPPAQAASGGVFLFAREVMCGLGLRAAVLDRLFPRRSECRRALVHLARPRFPAHAQAQLESLRRLARSSGRHRVLLLGPHGSGISDWIAQMAEEIAPPVWLDIRALGASLAPLSGLMYALRRLPTGAAPEQVLTGAGEADQQALAALRAIRAGGAVSRREAVLALRQYIGRASESGRRAWISVDPAPLIDPSTVGVAAEVAREGGPDALLMMRLPLDSKPPEVFARGGGLSEVRVRGLSQHEARALAASMLQTDLPSDVARRAAVMGGDNPLAVAEAVRVLVASGEVIFADGGFRWRRGPAGRLNTMSLESLIEERIDGLDAPLQKALEVLATMPDPDDRELAAQIAVSDGLSAERWARALEELDGAALVRMQTRRPAHDGSPVEARAGARERNDVEARAGARERNDVEARAGARERNDAEARERNDDERAVSLSTSVRLAVQASMAPVRTLELNRAITAALAPSIGVEHGFARANLAYYLARAGEVEQAAELFLEVAALSGQHGFLRSGVRLAAAAVECDPSPTTRARAAEIAERLSLRASGAAGSAGPDTRSLPRPPAAYGPRPGTIPPARGIASEARERAVRAILARDFDEVDRAFELLVAAGRDGASIERLRTISLLVKGDALGALALLERLRERQRESAPSAEREPPRLTLTAALVSIATGELEPAVRASLDALAQTRETGDALGERAALSVLSMCYRRLGREADATQLAHAALEQLSAASS